MTRRTDDRGKALARAHELAGGFLDGLDERPVWPRANYDDMLAALDGRLQSEQGPHRGAGRGRGA
jgi:hypothetical protein